MSARALVESLGPDKAIELAGKLHMSMLTMNKAIRRYQAYSLFEAGNTVQVVRARMGLSQSTAYFFFEQWREYKAAD